MASRFSRIFDYGSRSRADYDLARSNVIRELGRENSELTAQVNELKQETEILRDLIRRKEAEIRDIRSAVEEREFEDMNINEMADKLEAKLNELEAKVDAQAALNTDNVEEKLTVIMEEKTQAFSKKADELADKMYAVTRDSGVDSDQIVNIISENVHSESVKCYRNIQSILEEMDDKLTAIENKKVSISGTTALVVITMLVSMGNLALIVLRILGMI